MARHTKQASIGLYSWFGFLDDGFRRERCFLSVTEHLPQFFLCSTCIKNQGTLISRLKLNACLYDLPPERQLGAKGRKRLRGDRLRPIKEIPKTCLCKAVCSDCQMPIARVQEKAHCREDPIEPALLTSKVLVELLP